MIEHIIMLVGAAMLVIGVAVAVSSCSLRRRIVETVKLLPHATRGEKIMICAGIGLLFAGPLLVGPLDEILALALIGRAARKIERRAVDGQASA